MSAKRPSTCGLIASRSNAPAQIRASSPLLAEMQKWFGPERDEALGEAALGQRRALQPRQRLGAKRLLDHVERLRRRLCRIVRRLRLRHPACDLRRRRIQRGIAAEPGVPFGRRGRRRLSGRGGLRRLARLLDLVLIGKDGLPELRRRLQSRRFQQHAVGTRKLGLHEAARVGACVDEIARRAAAGAEAKAVERDEGSLRIAGHRSVLGALKPLS
ncbi:hypothetical protein ABIA43_001454 [Bradyrhizobium sp. USDA 328]